MDPFYLRLLLPSQLGVLHCSSHIHVHVPACVHVLDTLSLGEGGRREEGREEGNKSTCVVHMGQSGSHEALLLAMVLVSLAPGSLLRAHSKGHQSLRVHGGEPGTRLGGREENG